MDRSPVVAGFFYPKKPEVLWQLLDELFLEHPLGPKRSPGGDESNLGILVPHAGYVYSGPCAAHGFVHLPKVETIVLVGPNHTGMGAQISVRPDGKRISPIGSLEVDKEFVDELVSSTSASKDAYGHLEEHCLEVQLPFIIYVYTKNSRELPKIVPITLLNQSPHVAAEMAAGILETSRKLGRRIAIVATSDLNHYEPHTVTVAKDNVVLECIKNLDIDCLYNTVLGMPVSVCGYGAIATAMDYTKRLNGKAEILKHMTSGDVTGDKGSVVGYASARFYRRDFYRCEHATYQHIV